VMPDEQGDDIAQYPVKEIIKEKDEPDRYEERQQDYEAAKESSAYFMHHDVEIISRGCLLSKNPVP